MSVVAGCSLLDGVLLAADCRITIKREGRADVYADNVQKLFPIAPHTAIGFVGDVDIASFILRNLIIKKQRKRRLNDPIGLQTWITRLFRRAFSAYTSRKGKRDILFMVASALKDRNNIVERQAVANLANYIFFGGSPIKRNFIPNIIAEILKTPPEYTHVEIPNTSRGLLYVMRSPNFEIEPYKPLQFTAIGSGESVHEEIMKYQDSIFAFEPGNSFIESLHLRETIRQFIDERHILSVGGLYPVLKISGKGIECLGHGVTTGPAGGTRIELVFEEGRWFQRNITTGKEIMLLYPWEVKVDSIKKDHTFDDLNIAFR